MTRLIRGAGEMTDLVRSFNWATTSLGAIDSWSVELLTAVNIILMAPDPMFLYWGEDLAVLYNDAARPMTSHKHPGALGSSARDVWGEAWHIIGPDIDRVFNTGEPAQRIGVMVPLMTDGALRDLYWNYSYSAVMVGNLVAGTLVCCANITDAVLSEKALLETKRQLQQVLNATTDAVFSLNREWNFTYLNTNAKRLLSAYGDLIGRNLWEAFPDTQYENSPFVREYTRSMNDGLAGEFDTYYPEPEGWFQVVSRPAPDGIIVFFRDITASKKAAGALIESEKLAAVGRLAASIAHEINNPLEAVTNLVYLARASDSLDESREHLQHADHELRRVAAITNHTLRFHKQSTMPTQISPVDLLDSVVTVYQGRLAAADINVERRTHGARLIHCFEGEVRQVLSNLVGNAIDAMSTGERRLLLRVRGGREWGSEKEGIVFTVADSGCGMPPNVVARVFEAFYTTKGFTGTGLGLWVSKEIVDRHCGRLRVRSSRREARSGTVFTLFLPFDAVNRS